MNKEKIFFWTLPMMTLRRFIFLLNIFFLILIIDGLTKFSVHCALPLIGKEYPTFPFGGISIFSFLGIDFAIVHTTNTGAAYGVFSKFQFPLLLLRIVLIGILSIYLLFFNRKREADLPLTLVIAGALGNVFDTFIYGHVVDMFQFIFWGMPFAVFNVADAAISIGIVWIFFLAWFGKEETVS